MSQFDRVFSLRGRTDDLTTYLDILALHLLFELRQYLIRPLLDAVLVRAYAKLRCA